MSTTVEFIMLRLLSSEPGHGYSLQKRICELRHVFPVGGVNVYPVLRNLVKQGLATAKDEIVNSRMRRTYEIADDGERALREWIAADHENRNAAVRDEASLKLLLGSTQSCRCDWILAEVAAAEAEVERLSSWNEQTGAHLSATGHLVSAEQLALAQRRVEFLREAYQLVAGSPPPTAG